MGIAATGFFLLAAFTVSTCGSSFHYENPNSLANELELLDVYLNKRSDNARSSENSKSLAGLWFGPRLGRKKRSTDDNELLLKVLQDGPWALLTMKDGSKRQAVNNFTPRLGRGYEEDIMENMIDPSISSNLPRNSIRSDSVTYAGSSFTPRLGRKILSHSDSLH